MLLSHILSKIELCHILNFSLRISWCVTHTHTNGTRFKIVVPHSRMTRARINWYFLEAPPPSYLAFPTRTNSFTFHGGEIKTISVCSAQLACNITICRICAGKKQTNKGLQPSVRSDRFHGNVRNGNESKLPLDSRSWMRRSNRDSAAIIKLCTIGWSSVSSKNAIYSNRYLLEWRTASLSHAESLEFYSVALSS